MQEEIQTIVISIPQDHLGDLVGMFDDAGLGFSLRMPETVMMDKKNVNQYVVRVPFVSDDAEKVATLFEIFKQVAWAYSPRIESLILEEQSPETIARVEQRLVERRFFSRDYRI